MYFVESLSLVATLVAVGFGVWQFKSASNLKKVVNDNTRSLYKDSQQIIEYAKQSRSYDLIAERGRAIKSAIIHLDITNRNLNSFKIDKLKAKGLLSLGEAEEYKKFSSK